MEGMKLLRVARSVARAGRELVLLGTFLLQKTMTMMMKKRRNRGRDLARIGRPLAQKKGHDPRRRWRRRRRRLNVVNEQAGCALFPLTSFFSFECRFRNPERY